MGKQFKDNLPLKGEVHVKNDVRVYIYEGYEAGNTRRCALRVKGEDQCSWFDRTVITPVSES
jgi:hypothetical protein